MKGQQDTNNWLHKVICNQRKLYFYHRERNQNKSGTKTIDVEEAISQQKSILREGNNKDSDYWGTVF